MRVSVILLLVSLLIAVSYLIGNLVGFSSAGKAYVDIVKCTKFSRMADQAKASLAKCDGQCEDLRSLSASYNSYLEAYCDISCDSLETRCRSSNSGLTSWVEGCVDGRWVAKDFCHSGCSGSICSGTFDFRVSVTPEHIGNREMAVVVVTIMTEKAGPIQAVAVELGSTAGYLMSDSLVTDEYGQVFAMFAPYKRGVAVINAVATVDGQYLRDSAFTFVG
ncbi:MAG: hypothetical protein ABIF10_08390 [Candidatus Woesearchaeota archaeon]